MSFLPLKDNSVRIGFKCLLDSISAMIRTEATIKRRLCITEATIKRRLCIIMLNSHKGQKFNVPKKKEKVNHSWKKLLMKE